MLEKAQPLEIFQQAFKPRSYARPTEARVKRRANSVAKKCWCIGSKKILQYIALTTMWRWAMLEEGRHPETLSRWGKTWIRFLAGMNMALHRWAGYKMLWNRMGLGRGVVVFDIELSDILSVKLGIHFLLLLGWGHPHACQTSDRCWSTQQVCTHPCLIIIITIIIRNMKTVSTAVESSASLSLASLWSSWSSSDDSQSSWPSSATWKLWALLWRSWGTQWTRRLGRRRRPGRRWSWWWSCWWWSWSSSWS